MNVTPTSRIWKKADLFTAIVEIHSATFKRQRQLSPPTVGRALSAFYEKVDNADLRGEPESDASRYKAALQPSNDRSSRTTRGEIIRRLLDSTLQAPA